jgi:hypothetical protein
VHPAGLNPWACTSRCRHKKETLWGSRGLPSPWQTSVHQVASLSQPECVLLSNLGYLLKSSGQMPLRQQNLQCALKGGRPLWRRFSTAVERYRVAHSWTYAPIRHSNLQIGCQGSRRCMAPTHALPMPMPMPDCSFCAHRSATLGRQRKSKPRAPCTTATTTMVGHGGEA